MSKLAPTFLFLLFLPFSGTAQTSVSDLPPAQASALQKFLMMHSGLEFLSENQCDQEILKDMRKNFGAHFTPFYRKGDFNHDGRLDFAIILVKAGAPTEDKGPHLAETHRYIHALTVVVFNGFRGGTYEPVFIKNTKAPLVCFLNTTFEKKKRLSFGVYETDDGFVMTPAGQSYIVEHGPDKD